MLNPVSKQACSIITTAILLALTTDLACCQDRRLSLSNAKTSAGLIQETNSRLDVIARYPKFPKSIYSTALNKKIKEFAVHEIKHFKDDLVGLDAEGRVATFSSNYKFFLVTPDIISVQFLLDVDYPRSPQPVKEVEGFNYLVKRDKLVALEELFSPGVDYHKLVSAYALSKFLNTPEAIDINMLVEGMNSETVFKEFCITAHDITFFLNPGTIAAYADGGRNFSIPLDDIKSVLLPPFSSFARFNESSEISSRNLDKSCATLAIKALNNYISKKPPSADALRQRALWLSRDGRQDLAKLDLERAAQIDGRLSTVSEAMSSDIEQEVDNSPTHKPSNFDLKSILVLCFSVGALLLVRTITVKKNKFGRPPQNS